MLKLGLCRPKTRMIFAPEFFNFRPYTFKGNVIMNKIRKRHLKVLRATKRLREGKSTVINIHSAEECVELGLIEAGSKFQLTKNGSEILASAPEYS
jgi:hypothetical protein